MNFTLSAELLLANRTEMSEQVTNWVVEHYPSRTQYFEKCSRDVGYIIKALAHQISENQNAIETVSKMFFKKGVLQLKSTDVEFAAYEILLAKINELFDSNNMHQTEPGSFKAISESIERLKYNMENGVVTDNGFSYRDTTRESRIKHMFYNWDNEMEIIRNAQKCQRNWDYRQTIHPEVIDYLLWHAENAPSKQHEAYYDVYWTADRKVIEEATKYTWGSTHSRNPPSTWRNTQANANMYMLFVGKESETNLNCHSDGTLKSNKDPARWENSYVSVGIAMGLVMRAANALGLATGCNKSHGDMNGDMFWERKLGIEEDVLAGRKKIAYGIGIGYPQEGRPRWETDDYELAIGAGNGSNLTTDPNMERHPVTDKKMRKVKIVDIRTCDEATDPYGTLHQIPDESSIKINTMRKRIINITEIK